MKNKNLKIGVLLGHILKKFSLIVIINILKKPISYLINHILEAVKRGDFED